MPVRRAPARFAAMKVDGGLGLTPELGSIVQAVGDAEEAGYDGFWTAETSHDPFFPLVIAAEHSHEIELGTGIAVAFARNPMSMAMTANDLQLLSKGRFLLGLGSQIKPHITKRFSMEWSSPAARMREFVLAMRAIWDCWHNGTKLDFRGDFYTHTLMTPFFDPGPNEYGPPKVFLAAVGEKMTEVVGETCDGMLCHGFTTERYLREVTLPALARGLGRSGRSRVALELSLPAFVVTGTDDEEMAASAKGVRQQIAFYGSTPSYRPVLELHGWGGLQEELNGLSKQGDWAKMGELIDDEILQTFAVVGEPSTIAPELLRRFGDVVDRISFYAPYKSQPETWLPVIDALKKG
jgi:probable F420-dependent oxidoreductase